MRKGLLEQLHDTRSSDSLSDEGIQEAEFESVGSGEPGERAQAPENPELAIRIVEAESVLKRSRSLLETVHAEDKEEMIDLHEQIDEAIDESNIDSLSQGIDSLKELLFFVEGK